MQRINHDSEVYKMIQENRESRAAPRQSNTFRMLQEVLEADERGSELTVLLEKIAKCLYLSLLFDKNLHFIYCSCQLQAL